MVGSRRSALNQTLVLKVQYEKALQDLQELVDTAQDKMAADQKTTAGSALEVQILLDKHKVCIGWIHGPAQCVLMVISVHISVALFPVCVGVFSGSGGPCGADAGLLQAGQCGDGAERGSGAGADRSSG